jgi:hypothetical protein
VRRLVLLAFALAGCDQGFRYESQVTDLRLLGVRATPADLAPGESARLEALVLDPSRAELPTVLWVGCAADPFNQNRSPCADSAVLQDPGALTGGTGTLPDGVSVIGFNGMASYSAPTSLFAPLAADDSIRQTGTVGLVLAFAVAETVSPTANADEVKAVFDRVQKKEIKSVLSLFRLRISENTERNVNPTVDALLVNGARWPENARVGVKRGQAVPFDLVAPDGAFEPYTAITPAGTSPTTEKIQVAWYSATGTFSQTNTALREAVTTTFTAPTGDDPRNPLPERPQFSMWTVLRDSRGGQSWRTWSLYLCDETLLEPTVTEVSWPASSGEPVVLRGSNLASVLDVVVDGVALTKPAYSPSSGTWEGFLPSGLAIGQRRGTVSTKRCTAFSL